MKRVTSSEKEIRKAYGNMSSWYPIVGKIFEKNIRKKSLEMLNVQKGESILEIGFGTGYFLVELAKSVGKKGKIYGIDITPEMVELAKKRIEKKGLGQRLKLCNGNAKNLPYKNNLFDAVYISFTLDLLSIQDISKVLKEIKRVLKPGGRLGIVTVAKKGYENSKALKFYKWIYKKIPNYSSCPIYIKENLKNAGYKIRKTHETKIAKLFPVKIVVARL